MSVSILMRNCNRLSRVNVHKLPFAGSSLTFFAFPKPFSVLGSDRAPMLQSSKSHPGILVYYIILRTGREAFASFLFPDLFNIYFQSVMPEINFFTIWIFTIC